MSNKSMDDIINERGVIYHSGRRITCGDTRRSVFYGGLALTSFPILLSAIKHYCPNFASEDLSGFYMVYSASLAAGLVGLVNLKDAIFLKGRKRKSGEIVRQLVDADQFGPGVF